MLTKQQEAFLNYWEKNREKEKKNSKQFIVGLTVGLLIGVAIVFFVVTGWYQRANMQLNTKTNPIIFLIIIAAIAVFMAYLYKSHVWDMQEQEYRELLAKKQKAQQQHLQNMQQNN